MDKELFASLVRSVEEMVAIEAGEFSPPEENIHRNPIPERNAQECDSSGERVSKGDPLARD